MWLTDDPASVEDLVTALKAGGARVWIAQVLFNAIHVLSTTPTINAVVSDIRRDGNVRAGIEELGRLRSSSGYTGLVIHYANVLPSDLGELTLEQDTAIAWTPSQLLSLLAIHAREVRAGE